MSVVVSAFDLSGWAVRPWAEAGAKCFCLDINAYVRPREHEVYPSGGSVEYIRWDASAPGAIAQVRDLKPTFLISMAPCTDLTVAGAKHFEGKHEADPAFWLKAMNFVRLVPDIAQELSRPWMFENPVGMISRFWRPPDAYFDPCDYGGYLHPDDKHPEWPDYIPPRDGYTKKTGIWAGGGFIMPGQRLTQVEYNIDSQGRSFNRQTAKLGGKSERTKQIRSLSPRGFFQAVFEANCKLVLGREPEIPEWRATDESVYGITQPRMIF